MQLSSIPQKGLILKKMNALAAIIVSLLVLAGCAASYGRIKRNAEVKQAFESNQVRTDYKYYYYGFKEKPYAMIGVDSKYDASSKMWREIDPQTEEFKKATYWIWQDFDYYPYGAYILDPSGNEVGLWFSSIRIVAIKFVGENRIVVMPHTPFLWGPAIGNDGSHQYFGNVSSENFFAKTH